MNNFDINWTEDNGIVICYSSFHTKVTKTVYREYKREMISICKEYNFPIIYCIEPLNDITLNRFVQKLGFKKVKAFHKNKEFFNLYRMDSICYK